MQYLGGKSRLAKRIISAMNPPDRGRFVDVFTGALSVVSHAHGNRIANDACRPLVSMYEHWRTGWRPSAVSAEQYAELRTRQDPDDPMTAFAGFALSFGGKWFGGMARNSRGRDYHATACRSIGRKMSLCDGVLITCRDFGDIDVSKGDTVYCDPPYKGTTKYGHFGGFDHERFVECARSWSSSGANVFVSEYTEQPGWVEVASWPGVASQLSANKVERLFRVA